MDRHASFVTLSVCLVLLAVSSSVAQTPTPSFDMPSFPQLHLDPGLRSEKRELICPHSSARALNSFSVKESAAIPSIADSVYKTDIADQWAYLDVGHDSVPTLMPDGSTLDYHHPNNVDFVLYRKRDGTSDKSFWARRYDNGDIVTTKDKLRDEGVDDFSGIAADVKKKKFCLVTGRLGNFNHLKDIVWTNTIFVDGYLPPSDLSEFQRINEQLLVSLPPSEAAALANNEAFVITTARSNSGNAFVTNFAMDQSVESKHLIGYMHPVGRDTVPTVSMLDQWFAAVKPGARVYVYGAEIGIDFAQLANKHNVQLIRRGPTIVKDLVKTDHQIRAISSRRLYPPTTAVLNGIPATKRALESMDKPSGDIQGWIDFRSQVDQALVGHYADRIETKQHLVTELTRGDRDVIFLIAHFDGKSIYFGEEKVSLDELEALPSRRSGTRPRVAVLFICNSGVLSETQRSFFRKQVKSVGELFIRKGFFEQVIAPQHEIEDPETMRVLTQYLADNRIQEQGWINLAEITTAGEPENEIFHQP